MRRCVACIAVKLPLKISLNILKSQQNAQHMQTAFWNEFSRDDEMFYNLIDIPKRAIDISAPNIGGKPLQEPMIITFTDVNQATIPYRLSALKYFSDLKSPYSLSEMTPTKLHYISICIHGTVSIPTNMQRPNKDRVYNIIVREILVIMVIFSSQSSAHL